MRILRKAIIVIISASILSPYAAAYELTESEHIFADGIIHKEIRADDYFNDGSGRNEIFNVLEVDFSKKEYRHFQPFRMAALPACRLSAIRHMLQLKKVKT